MKFLLITKIVKQQKDKSKIIDTGILKDYCLGLLSEKEEKKVELICREHSEVAKELQILKLALEKYSRNEKVMYRIDLRKSVWNAIKKIWGKDFV